MLEIRDLNVTAGEFSLSSVNLKIEKGSFHVIVGHTGSGKTLLLECMLGLRKVQANSIFLDGTDSVHIPIEKRNMAYVPQDFAIFPHLNVEQNIRYGLAVNNKALADESLINELIEITGIRSLLHRRTKHLSGGEKQRIAFVRALAAGRKVLVLDEPLSSLNKTLKYELQHLLLRLHKKYALTIIMVTHDLEETFTLAENISVIQDGRILQSSPKDILYRQPASTEVARFLGISNLFSGVVKEVGQNRIRIYSKELGIELWVPTESNFLPGNNTVVGIRNDELMILRPGMVRKNQTNLLEANIESILKKESTFLVRALPVNGTASVYIEVPAYAFGKLGIQESDRIEVTLREEMIFVTP